jgi:hypothetical protein
MQADFHFALACITSSAFAVLVVERTSTRIGSTALRKYWSRNGTDKGDDYEPEKKLLHAIHSLRPDVGPFEMSQKQLSAK